MQAASDPLLQNPPTWKQKLKQVLKKILMWLAVAFLVVFVIVWIIQGILFWFATSFSGCSASKLTDYSYPGGGTSESGGPEVNLVPKIALLAERPPMWYGQAYDVIPSNEASTIADAPVGTWWRTWGPIFNTYTYEDVANSRTTLYMRRNLLRLGMSHRIVRCDGKEPWITFTEGSNVLVNRVRHAFGMNQGYSFKIFKDDEQVAVAEETSHGFPSMTFQTFPDEVSIGSSVLQDRHFHGQYDLWLVKNEDSTPLPFYVSNAATLLFAISELHIKLSGQPSAAAPSPAPATPPKTFLALENRTSAADEAAAEAMPEAAAAAPPPQVLAEASSDVAGTAELLAPAASPEATGNGGPAAVLQEREASLVESVGFGIPHSTAKLQSNVTQLLEHV